MFTNPGHLRRWLTALIVGALALLGLTAVTAPMPATAAGATPTITKKILAISPTGGVRVQVTGAGFQAVTNPGDAGIYVAVAQSGGLPDVSSQSGMASFVAMAYLPPGQLVDGSFVTTLNLPTAKLSSANSYSIYTWQAHTHSNTTQDTVTALPINFGQLTNAPTATAVVTKQNVVDGVSINVSGTHFVGSTNPGDNGVYLGLAPRGGLPDVSNPAGMAAFAVVDYLPGAALASGVFTRTLTVSADKLTPGTSYAVYTWQAHGHSNTSQDTVTPVALSWPTLGTDSVPGIVAFGSAAAVEIVVPGGGTVTMSGYGAPVTATVVGGRAAFRLPEGLPVGVSVLTFSYSGDAANLPGLVSRTITVQRSATNLAASQVGASGAIQVTVFPAAGGPAATGPVRVTLQQDKKSKKTKGNRVVYGALVEGVATINPGKLDQGKWIATIDYVGSVQHAPATGKLTLQVKQVKKARKKRR